MTQLLLKELPPGGTYSPQQVWNAYKQVYGDVLGRQDWLDAIWPYFEKTGQVAQ